MRGVRSLLTVVVVGSFVVLAGIVSGCGSSSAPAAATPTPTPLGPVANLAGTWTGTLQSANFPAVAVGMTVSQSGNCVDGAWQGPAASWSGAISGYAGADSFSGQISFERPDAAGGRCTAVGDATGPVSGGTFQLTSAGFSAVGTCSGDLPRSVVLTLRHQ